MEASALALVGLMGLVLLWLAHLNAMAQHGNDVNGCFNGVEPQSNRLILEIIEFQSIKLERHKNSLLTSDSV